MFSTLKTKLTSLVLAAATIGCSGVPRKEDESKMRGPDNSKPLVKKGFEGTDPEQTIYVRTVTPVQPPKKPESGWMCGTVSRPTDKPLKRN